MNIGTRKIESDQPPYVIAEIGVNHDGSVDRAIELVECAKRAEADAIKLQLFQTDLLLSKAAKLAAYQEQSGATDPFQMLRSLELSAAQMKPIVDRSHQLELHAIVTVFSVELVAEAEQLNWDAYKTASPDIINKPLLQALASTDKPLIVSTGASTLQEVKRAIEWLVPTRTRMAVLQCVSSYPTRPEDASIGGLRDLATIWKGPLGYSDHTRGVHDAGWVAVAAGACILEKHITWRNRATGPDHAASLEPHQFAEYVQNARWVRTTGFDEFKRREGWVLEDDEAFGQPIKRVLPSEQDVRTNSRQSLVTTRSLPRNHVLRADDMTIKRPGTGIPPFEFDRAVNRRLACDIEADMPLTKDHLA